MQPDDIVFIRYGWLMKLVLDNQELKEKVKELQDEADRLRHRNEYGSRYDPFVRNSGH